MSTPRPIPLRPDYSAHDREWKRSFIRASTARVIGAIQKSSSAEILKATWPDDSRASLILRAPVETLKQTDFPGSSVTRLLLLAPKSGAAQLFPLGVTVDLRGVNSFSFPSPQNFANANFIGEGQPIPVRQGVYSGFGIGPVRKLALLAGLSRELQEASAITEAIISNTLEVAVGRGLDAVLFSADAEVADIAPAGLLFGVVPIAGSASMSADLSALVASISSSGIDTNSVVFVCSPPQAISLSLLAGPHFTHKIIEASALASGTVVAVAVSALIVAGDGGNPVIDTSKQAVLHYADPASPISTSGAVAAPTLSQFQTDTLALKCTSRICWSAAPGAIAFTTDAQW